MRSLLGIFALVLALVVFHPGAASADEGPVPVEAEVVEPVDPDAENTDDDRRSASTFVAIAVFVVLGVGMSIRLSRTRL